MSKLNLNPMADWGYVNNSRFRFLSIRNQGGGVEPEPVIPTDRILYKASIKPTSKWITENCIENNFESLIGILDEVNMVVNTIFRDASMEQMDLDTNIKEIIIPTQVTEINNYAFFGCSALNSLNLPEGIITIGFASFAYCTSLQTLIIPSTVTNIGLAAFYDCTELESVTSNSILPPIFSGEVGENPFVGILTKKCNVPNGSEEAYINSEWSDWFDTFNDIHIDNRPKILYTVVEGGVKPTSTWITTNCSENVFDAETGEGYLVLKEGLSELGTLPGRPTKNIFNDSGEDANVISVIIPKQITRITGFAFSSCITMETIELPTRLSFIDENSFENCQNLLTVISKNIIPPLMSRAGNNFPASGDTLYVPSESVSTYQANSAWNSAFTTITAIQ